VRAFKLVRKRKDGTYGSLFIKRRAVLPVGRWMSARNYPTKGFAERPGWHCTLAPHAPHLTMKGRVWVEVELRVYREHQRPSNQGGTWLLAQRMKIIKEVQPDA
jgi:hypothetical protein